MFVEDFSIHPYLPEFAWLKMDQIETPPIDFGRDRPWT